MLLINNYQPGAHQAPVKCRTLFFSRLPKFPHLNMAAPPRRSLILHCPVKRCYECVDAVATDGVDPLVSHMWAAHREKLGYTRIFNVTLPDGSSQKLTQSKVELLFAREATPTPSMAKQPVPKSKKAAAAAQPPPRQQIVMVYPAHPPPTTLPVLPSLTTVVPQSPPESAAKDNHASAAAVEQPAHHKYTAIPEELPKRHEWELRGHAEIMSELATVREQTALQMEALRIEQIRVATDNINRLFADMRRQMDYYHQQTINNLDYAAQIRRQVQAQEAAAALGHTKREERLDSVLRQHSALQAVYKSVRKHNDEGQLVIVQLETQLQARISTIKEQEDTIRALRLSMDAREIALAEENECSICLTAAADTAAVPCGHRNFCYACLTDVHRRADSKCPLCQGPFTAVLRLY